MDRDLVAIHRNLHFKFPKLGEGVVTFRDQPSSASPPFYINFNFTSQQITQEFVVPTQFTSTSILHQLNFTDPDVMQSSQFVRQVDEPMLRKTVRVTVIDQNTSETIDEELKDWPMEGTDRQRFIETAIKRAQRFIPSMPPHHNVLDLDFRVVSIQVDIYSPTNFQNEDSLMDEELVEESEEMEEEEEEEEEESSCFMVPATDSCIESLERKIINGGCGRNQNCTICLEEFPAAGSEVISMPCSHIFHRDCIQKWLRTSHYCPLCRFEMRKNRA